VEYTVRAARITDVERVVALSGDRIRVRGAAQHDAADLLRQLVFLPHATVLVAERRRGIVGGAVLAMRPSVATGGYIGTIDLLAVDADGDDDEVTGLLVDELLRSAANKGCVSVEAPLPTDPSERARWEDRGFTGSGSHLERNVAPAGPGARRAR
jgi:hypothetical protein